MARYAIVIGIATNLSPLKSLSKTAGDATAIADLLEAQGDFVAVKRLMGEVSQAQIESALKTLLLEQADRSEVVIYYTGHGFPLVESFGKQRVYLAPSDCRVMVRDGQVVAQEGGIALEGLNGLFQQANLSNLVVFLECCYSGAMLDHKSVQDTMTAFSQTDYFLIAACREFETAYALKDDAHSVFTTALLRGLREKKNDRGQVTTGSLFDFVYEQMRGLGQEPMHFGLGRSLSVVSYRPEVQEVAQGTNITEKINQDPKQSSDENAASNKVADSVFYKSGNTSAYAQEIFEIFTVNGKKQHKPEDAGLGCGVIVGLFCLWMAWNTANSWIQEYNNKNLKTRIIAQEGSIIGHDGTRKSQIFVDAYERNGGITAVPNSDLV